jgi:RHS repeat-associated protein
MRLEIVADRNGSLNAMWYSLCAAMWHSYSGTGDVTSDSSMNVAQWFDYAPYGSVIASTNTGTSKAARQYIGQFTDDSGLSYLNARYFNSGQGQFTTQDPTFLAAGNPNQLQQMSQQDQQRFLSDPQQMNAYSPSYSAGLEFELTGVAQSVELA